mmetsp:Transcript_16290/g.38252  ORF Transcript_16290/g.38252 Transcript_16290/m.38252 type:complete len:361 (+) Transcript_16290:163-1245(+)
MPQRVGVILPHDVVDQHRHDLANHAHHGEACGRDQVPQVEPGVGYGQAYSTREEHGEERYRVPASFHELFGAQQQGGQQRQRHRQGVVVVHPGPRRHGNCVQHELHEHHLYDDGHIVNRQPRVALDFETLVGCYVDDRPNSNEDKGHDASHVRQRPPQCDPLQERHRYRRTRACYNDSLRVHRLQRLRVGEQAQEKDRTCQEEGRALLTSDELYVSLRPGAPYGSHGRRAEYKLAEEHEGCVLDAAHCHCVDQDQRGGASGIERHSHDDFPPAGNWLLPELRTPFHVFYLRASVAYLCRLDKVATLAETLLLVLPRHIAVLRSRIRRVAAAVFQLGCCACCLADRHGTASHGMAQMGVAP